MWRTAVLLALVTPTTGFASVPGQSEVPAAAREAVERYAADPTDANFADMQSIADLQPEGRASRDFTDLFGSYGPSAPSVKKYNCDEVCAQLMYQTGVKDTVPHDNNIWNWLVAYMEAAVNECECPKKVWGHLSGHVVNHVVVKASAMKYI